MKKIIVAMDNLDAIEVQENNRLAPRYGMCQLSFQDLAPKERGITLQFERILDGTHIPVLIPKLSKFANFSESEQEGLSAVLAKTVSLLKEGFHVLIIRGMVDCTCGRPSGLGYGCFDEKFSPAATDLEVRKDFWGTELLFPIEMVSALMLDMMNGVYPDDLREVTIKKSELVRYCLETKKQKLDDFVKFCLS